MGGYNNEHFWMILWKNAHHDAGVPWTKVEESYWRKRIAKEDKRMRKAARV